MRDRRPHTGGRRSLAEWVVTISRRKWRIYWKFWLGRTWQRGTELSWDYRTVLEIKYTVKYTGDGEWNPSFHIDVKGKLFLSYRLWTSGTLKKYNARTRRKKILFDSSLRVCTRLGIYTSHIHWVARWTWTPKDRDEVWKSGTVCLFPDETCLLWIDKARAKDKTYMSVGTMKDSKLKLWNLYDSHTLRGCSGNWNT